MAEIKIEKKSPKWPWVLLALLVIGVIVYFVFIHEENGEREPVSETPFATGVATLHHPGFYYINTSSGKGIDHGFSHEPIYLIHL